MILNIIVDECWRCKNDFLVAYIEDNCIPYGPSGFTDKQIKLAKDKGVKIDEVYSKTLDKMYKSCICPHCDSFLGDFFYHDFAYVPGNIQIELDRDDQVLKETINEEIALREKNAFDLQEENEKLETELEAHKKNQEKMRRNHELSEYNCIRVKFENGKNYPYNCPFDVKLGDTVYVEGKLQGVKGKVVKIVGKWKPFKNMQEVIKVDKMVQINE